MAPNLREGPQPPSSPKEVVSAAGATPASQTQCVAGFVVGKLGELMRPSEAQGSPV